MRSLDVGRNHWHFVDGVCLICLLHIDLWDFCKHLLYILVDVKYLVLKQFDWVHEMFAWLLGFDADHLPAFGGLVFHEVLDDLNITLPIVDILVILFLLPDDKNIWKIFFVVEVFLTKVNLFFVNHNDPLPIVVGRSILIDFWIWLSNNCNNEVHENHE